MSTDFQVLIGPDENDGLGPWYFSLNNRRLWVLKQCQKEGLLDNARCSGMIAVRVRAPRSEAEKQRYSVGNCALEAKFTREGIEGGGGPVVAMALASVAPAAGWGVVCGARGSLLRVEALALQPPEQPEQNRSRSCRCDQERLLG